MAWEMSARENPDRLLDIDEDVERGWADVVVHDDHLGLCGCERLAHLGFGSETPGLSHRDLGRRARFGEFLLDGHDSLKLVLTIIAALE